jgi:hypothetical protein
MLADELYSRAIRVKKEQETKFSSEHQYELTEIKKMLEEVAEGGLTKISFDYDSDNPVTVIKLSDGTTYVLKSEVIDFVLSNSKTIAKITGLKINVTAYSAPYITISFDQKWKQGGK